MSDFNSKEWTFSFLRSGFQNMRTGEFLSSEEYHQKAKIQLGIFRQEDIDNDVKAELDKSLQEYITNSYRAVTYKRGDESIMSNETVRGSTEEISAAESRKERDAAARKEMGEYILLGLDQADNFVYTEGSEQTGPMGGKSYEVIVVDDNGTCFAINVYSDSRIEEKVDRKVQAEKAERERVAERLAVLSSLTEGETS